MDGKRTPAWGATRIELAIGIGALLFGALAFVSLPAVMFGADATRSRVIVLAALLVIVAGLAWMVRISRGPRDEPPRWRYRDR